MAPKKEAVTTASVKTGLGGASAAASTLAPNGLSAGRRRIETTGGSLSFNGVSAGAAGAPGGGVGAGGAWASTAENSADPAKVAMSTYLEKDLIRLREV
jgi:hypothetical protein